MSNTLPHRLVLVFCACFWLVPTGCRSSGEGAPPVAAEVPPTQQALKTNDNAPPQIEGPSSVLGEPPQIVAGAETPPQLRSPAQVLEAMKSAFTQRQPIALARLTRHTDSEGQVNDVQLADIQRNFLQGTRLGFWQRIFKNANAQDLEFRNSGSRAELPVDVGGAIGSLTLHFEKDASGLWFLSSQPASR